MVSDLTSLANQECRSIAFPSRWPYSNAPDPTGRLPQSRTTLAHRSPVNELGANSGTFVSFPLPFLRMFLAGSSRFGRLEVPR